MVLRREITSQILALMEENPSGLSVTDIAKSVRVNRNTAGRYLENLLVSGKVEMHRSGMSKVYVPSKRVPLSAVLSISSDLVVQLDSFQRIIFVNEPFLKLIGTDTKNLLGKNIEFTPVVTVFDQAFAGFLERIRRGITGEDWAGEIELDSQAIILFCRIAPTVFEDGRRGVSVFFENITQRKKAEDALRESEERYRTLSEASQDLIFLIDRDDRVIYVNSYAAALLGLPADQIIGKKRSSLFPEKLAEVQTERLHRVFESGEAGRSEGAIEIFGTPHYFDHYLVPVIDAHGRVESVLGISRDITERKENERALRESEERYRQLVEISPDAVIIHQEGRIVFLNPAALTMLGVTDPREILGKAILDMIHPDFRDRVRKNISRDLQGEITPPTEVRMLRADGTTVPAEGQGVMTTYKGKPAVQVAIRDTTERHRTEERLHESEERYRQLVEISPDPVLIHQEGKIVFVNPAALTMLGLENPREIIGKDAFDLIHPDSREKVRKNIEADLRGEITPPIEIEMFRADGTIITAETHGVKTAIHGKPAIQVAIRDTTERHRMDEKLRESEDKYQFFINRALNGVIVIQDDFIKVCNQRAAGFYGDSPEKIVGRRFIDFIHPDARADVADRYHRRMTGEKTPPVYETVLIRKDGSRFYAEVNAGIITFEGRPADLIFLRDINDRKKAEEALREGPRGTGISDDLSFLVTGIKPDKAAK